MIGREILLDSLRRLKEYYGVTFIKSEFEAEGARQDELVMLHEMIDTVGLGFIIKIGGCEAIHDLDLCKLLFATGVMAPMIETPFAMEKFKGAFYKVFGPDSAIERIINAETVTCLTNFDAILDASEGFLTGVTVGRSDLSASMGISRDEIESDIILQATIRFLEKAKQRGLNTNFGGNIGRDSVRFVKQLHKLADRFETRKVVLKSCDNEKQILESILYALDFERKYLEFKSNYYLTMAREDESRLKRLILQLDGFPGR